MSRTSSSSTWRVGLSRAHGGPRLTSRPISSSTALSSLIGGVVHTHSTWATVWAQAGGEIPLFGTTHADLCPGAVPIARRLSDDEVRGAYEENTGVVLREVIGDRGIDEVPCALVPGHGPFTWGASVAQAVERAVTLEAVARMALLTLFVRPGADPLPAVVVDRHFTRKHGPGAYYGQPG